MTVYRDLLKHSAVYGLGQILSRLASVLLLPVYTYYLSPADYGVIAILDVLAGLLGIAVGAGMTTAVNRFHFAEDTDRPAVWWTGLFFVAAAGAVITVPTWCFRGTIAADVLGIADPDGGRFLTLALATLWFTCLGRLPESYLRVQKWSTLVVGLSLLRLLLNVGLNVYFLAVGRMGLEAILLGNLLTSAVLTAVFCGIQAVQERPVRFDLLLLSRMLRFGAPLIVTAVLSMVMHQADRYLLRLYLSMDAVGIYSLAYQIGQGINTLCLVPFAAIWGVVVYEIAEQPDCRAIYARVFQYFTDGLALVMLGASLFARPVLALLTPEEFAGAGDLIPLICAAYFFFSLHEHFRVPVLLAKKTLNLVPAFALGAVLNIAGNVLLIPRLGAAGAAWASVVAFAAFSFFGLSRYRQTDRYPYRLGRLALVLAGMAATWYLCRPEANATVLGAYVIPLTAWLVWSVILFAGPAIRFLWPEFFSGKPFFAQKTLESRVESG